MRRINLLMSGLALFLLIAAGCEVKDVSPGLNASSGFLPQPKVQPGVELPPPPSWNMPVAVMLERAPQIGSEYDLFRFRFVVTGVRPESAYLSIANQDYPLYNDGQHQDILAGDAVWSAEISPVPLGTSEVYVTYTASGILQQERFYPDLTVIRKVPAPCASVINNGAKINIVIVTIGLQNGKSLVHTIIDEEGHANGLLSIEPFKSNKQNFNFWHVSSEDAASLLKPEDNAALGDDDLTKGYLLATACDLENKYVLFVLTGKSEGPEGRGSPGYGYARYDATAEDDLANTNQLIIHEFWGHAFGDLDDEYPNPKIGESKHPEQCYFSPYVNCTSEEEFSAAKGKSRFRMVCRETDDSLRDCIQHAPWAELIGKGCGAEGLVDCNRCNLPESPLCDNDETYKQYRKDINALVEVGCYLGCGHTANLYRSTPKSIMGTQNAFQFGQINERLLCKKIQSLTNKVEGICAALMMV